VARFVRSLRLIGLLFDPAMVFVLGLGIWMVIDSDAWTFGQGWVRLALGLFAVAFVVGALFQSRAAIFAQRAVDAGDQGEATRQLRRWSWGIRLILLAPAGRHLGHGVQARNLGGRRALRVSAARVQP